ncbi:MAG TPA: protein phosphatase 2C domain-containing protein [Terracidiphilus sp.]|jgi:protein phosphatase|nr:protein phosphatase 2C domain-containing protein [Terracidiphilus sp.]
MSVVSIPDAVAIQIASQCDRGQVREENQDTVRHTGTSLGDLLVVADGIGGYPGGGCASQMAVETISSSVLGMPAFFPPEIAVEEAICRANAAIAAAAAEPDSPHSGMGTTAIVALLRADSDRARAPLQAIIGHVGDSRAYLVHNRKLTRLTRDHSVVQELADSGGIGQEEVETHPDASTLTRCLGRETNVRVEMREAPLEVGDTLLLCSDGLWGYVADREIERVLADPALDAQAASGALLQLALEAGGHDNVAIQLARIGVPPVRAVRAPAVAPSAPQPIRSAPPIHPGLRIHSGAPGPALRPEPPRSASSALQAAPQAAAAAHQPLRIFEPAPRPASMSLSIPIFTAASIAAPALEPSRVNPPQSEPAALASWSMPAASESVPVIELATTTPIDSARFADSIMLPELIIVPKINKINSTHFSSAFDSAVASVAKPARAQVGIGQIAAIFGVAFAASSALAYLALINNWFGILNLAR